MLIFRCLIAALCLFSASSQADSPITSISFSEGYDLEEIFRHDRDLIVRELALGDSSIGEKLAVTAEYPDQQELVSKLLPYLKILGSPRERGDYLLVLAYSRVLNNASDIETAKLLLALAYPDYSNRKSLLILESLLSGQEWFNDDDWDKIYPLVLQFNSLEPNLEDDVSVLVTEQFLRYLSLYEDYCVGCEEVGPSFSCENEERLSEIEGKICKSRRLSRADRILSEIYRFLHTGLEIGDVRASQLNWLSQRGSLPFRVESVAS